MCVCVLLEKGVLDDRCGVCGVQALDGDLFKPLDMTKTLAANGVADEEEEVTKLGLNPADFIPVIQIYFKDDLTVA